MMKAGSGGSKMAGIADHTRLRKKSCFAKLRTACAHRTAEVSILGTTPSLVSERAYCDTWW